MAFASNKTRQARDKLKSINRQLFENFFKNDLKLLRKKTTAQEVIEYALREGSNINKFALSLDRADNMKKFSDAIYLQSNSIGTKRDGLFYKMIFSIRNDLAALNPNPDSDDAPRKSIAQLKFSVKAFILAPPRKDKDNIDDEDDNRGKQIMDYLSSSKEDIEKIVILDDNNDGISSLFSEDFILINRFYGLNDEIYNKAIEILN